MSVVSLPQVAHPRLIEICTKFLHQDLKPDRDRGHKVNGIIEAIDEADH